jgi:hypothetical protein
MSIVWFTHDVEGILGKVDTSFLDGRVLDV